MGQSSRKGSWCQVAKGNQRKKQTPRTASPASATAAAARGDMSRRVPRRSSAAAQIVASTSAIAKKGRLAPLIDPSTWAHRVVSAKFSHSNASEPTSAARTAASFFIRFARIARMADFPVQKTDEEWRRILTPEQYQILRGHATER